MYLAGKKLFFKNCYGILNWLWKSYRFCLFNKKSAFLLQCPFRPNQLYCILPVSNTSSTKGACRVFPHRIPICGVEKMEMKIMTTKRHHDYTIFHNLFIYFKTALCGLFPFLHRHCFFSVLASAYPKVISSTKCLHKSTNLFISYWYFSLIPIQKYDSLNSKRYFSEMIFNLFQFSSFFSTRPNSQRWQSRKADSHQIRLFH